jgi:hypothetical protein
VCLSTDDGIFSRTVGSGSACVYAADHEGDGGSSGDGGGDDGSLHTSAGTFLAACSGETPATHHLLLGVLLWVVPRKVIPRQPAARVDNGDTQHLSVARRSRSRARASSRVVNARLESRFARDGFVNDNLGKWNHYFYVLNFQLLLFDGIGSGLAELDVSGRSSNRSRSQSSRS